MATLQTSGPVNLNVGGVKYETFVGTLLGENLKYYAHQVEQSNELVDKFHSDASLREPVPVPIILPTKFHEIFEELDRGATAKPLNDDSLNANANPAASNYIFRREENTVFIDRDGNLFRYILNYLRTSQLSLPLNFRDLPALLAEAKFYRLPHLEMEIAKMEEGMKSGASICSNNGQPAILPGVVGGVVGLRRVDTDTSSLIGKAGERGYITIGYRGTFAFGRDGQADVKFRKLARILVCGRVSLCREVFGDNLNESRDPDRGHYERYSSRFFLKHTFLEQAFDDLQRSGFVCACAAASGTSSNYRIDMSSGGSGSKQQDNEENRWNHYNEYVFYRS